MSLYLRVAQGDSISRNLQAQDYQGQGLTSYLSSDTLTGQVWPGEEQPVELTYTPTWVDAPTAKFNVTLSSADTTTLSIGAHRIRARATRGSNTYTLLDAILDVTSAPGASASSITPYCTYDDLLFVAPWCKQVQDLTTDQAGFLEERIRAREWLDWAILNNYRGASVGLFEQHSVAAFAFGGGVGWRRSHGPSTSLITYLSQNKLIVRPQIVRATAMKAASFIGLRQIGIQNAYVSYGTYFRDMADRELTATTAEIDLNGDGVGELFINLGSTNPLFS